MQQGILEPEFYGDLVCKLRKIVRRADFSDQFRKVIMRYKRIGYNINDFPYHFKKIVVRYKKIGYNINVLRQTACLVVNPIKVNSFAYLFNCTTVGRTSD